MNDTKIIKVKKLLLKKNFEEVIIFIENNFNGIEKTSEILNILGVSKLQKKNSSNFDFIIFEILNENIVDYIKPPVLKDIILKFM